MICFRCQSDNPPHAAFCDQCGARIEKACPNCGEPNRYGAKFCRNCGQAVDETATPSAAPAAGIPAPDTYVPKHLAEKILASRHQLEGERKQVTVLFADIKGSTKLLETLDPEEAQKLIDPVLQIMMDAVHKYEGTVNQVLGDGIMALFGAPLAHEDHALRACYAALAMQEEMRRHRQRVGQTEESGLHIGIGMNSGEVVVRSIDTDLNIDYSALGHTTHLAARMQELAGPGSALMSSSTLRQVEGFVYVQSLGPVQAKGISQPVEAYSLVGATTARTRVQAGAARGLTPLVGRNAEIETFNKLVDRASGGRGQILAMIGEPGVGKSRLVHEFTRHRLPPGWLVLEAMSVSYGKATPYFPLIEMLRRYFGIGPAEAREDIQTRVMTQILELDGALKDAIPPILSLLDAFPDRQSTAHNPDWLNKVSDVGEAITRFTSMDPQQRRRRTLDALKRLCIRESRRQNLLLVFEDLHWIDHETQSFLDGLIDSLPMAHLLLMVNYRPGYSHDWSEKSYYTQLRVEPLHTASAEELLSKLLGNNPDLTPLKRLLIKRTEGNPFFAEESVRSLVDTGVLSGEKGAYRPALPVNDIVIPSTVQNVVADRIDRLVIEEKHLLQTAAVIGVIVPFDLLKSVSQLQDERLFEYLAHLQSGEFVYETNLFPNLEYTFKHALTNEVAYSMLLHERRTSLHGDIVRALENITRHNPYDQIEMLAYHSVRGELWNKAVGYSRDAGMKSVSRSGFRQAVQYFEQALEALRHLPEDRDTLKSAVDLRLDMRNALFILGDFETALNYLREAQARAAILNDEGRLGQVLNLITAHWNLTGNSEEATNSAKQAITHTAAQEYRDLHIVAHYFLGVAEHNLGNYDAAVSALQRALSLIGTRKYELFGTTGIVSVICKAWLCRCLAQLGHFSDGLAFGQDALKTALERNHGYSIAYAYYGIGVSLLIKGDYEEAITASERGLHTCEVSDIPVQRPLITSCLGAAYSLNGQIDRGLQLLTTAVEHTATMRRLGGQSLRLAWLSESYILAAQFDKAEKLAREGLTLSLASKDKGGHAWLLKCLGHLLAIRSPSNTAEAEENYTNALHIAHELRMRPLEAHCHLALGQLYAQESGTAKCRAELGSAITLYQQMTMSHWLSKAETALATIA